MKIIQNILTDKGSKYSVSGGLVYSKLDAQNFIKNLKRNKKFSKATHNTWGFIGLLKGGTVAVDAVVAFQQSGAKLASIVPDSWEWGSSAVSTETADAPALTSPPDK